MRTRPSESGSRTRLAGWAKRPRFRGLLEDCFGETPKPARETRALPNLLNIGRRLYLRAWSRIEFWSGQGPAYVATVFMSLSKTAKNLSNTFHRHGSY